MIDETYVTPEEYLVREPQAEYKSEYRNGKVVAMSGATRRHVLLVTNLVRELSIELKGRPCEVYSNDLRLNVERAGLFTYPDVMLVCGKPEFLTERDETLLNPLLIIEVLSKSTEAYDRGEKFEYYKKIPSLRDYVLVDQSRVCVEQWVKQEDSWARSEALDLDGAIRFASGQCELSVRDVYDRIFDT